MLWDISEDEETCNIYKFSELINSLNYLNNDKFLMIGLS